MGFSPEINNLQTRFYCEQIVAISVVLAVSEVIHLLKV